MFDPELYAFCHNVKVRDVIKYLNTLPKDCEVNVNGDNLFYIHVEKDKSLLSFDDNSLSEEYNSEPIELSKIIEKRYRSYGRNKTDNNRWSGQSNK